MKNIPLRKFAGWWEIILLTAIFYGCTQDPVLWKVTSQEQVISDYIASNPDKYSEFGKLIETAGMKNLLSVRGPYTLFLPNNDAMLKFFQENNTTAEQKADAKFALKLVKNHLIANEIRINDIQLGALRDTNAIGDYLVTEFQGSDIMVNKKSKIIKRDIQAANGYIHVIDQVIDPVTANIFDLIKANPAYSIFAKGLELTGLKDTLQLVSFPFGKKMARTRFTVLAIADSTFKRFKINTVQDLIARYTQSPDSIKFLRNGFYRYMEYHCLGGTYYLSSFISKLYPILSSDNNIAVAVDTDYKLNYDRRDSTYTGFNIEQSNIPAKNGALHTINNLLPVTEPEPSTIVFDTTDYFDMKQGDYYGKYYMRWSYDNKTQPSPFAKIRWEGDYLQYYYKNHDAPFEVNYDALQMFGFFWIEITTPKIQKGHYKLSGYLWGKPSYEVYVDGVKSALIKVSDPDTPPWGEFTWTKTEEHKIKIVTVTWGTMFWDTVIFTPVK